MFVAKSNTAISLVPFISTLFSSADKKQGAGGGWGTLRAKMSHSCF